MEAGRHPDRGRARLRRRGARPDADPARHRPERPRPRAAARRWSRSRRRRWRRSRKPQPTWRRCASRSREPPRRRSRRRSTSTATRCPTRSSSWPTSRRSSRARSSSRWARSASTRRKTSASTAASTASAGTTSSGRTTASRTAMYGAALETWDEEPLTGSGVDVWCKRTRRLVVNDWYMTDTYHDDHGEGADFYSAGRTRGCGGTGLWRDGKLYTSRNFRKSRVLAAGPLRLVFELQYDPFDAGGASVARDEARDRGRRQAPAALREPLPPVPPSGHRGARDRRGPPASARTRSRPRASSAPPASCAPGSRSRARATATWAAGS